MPVKVKIDGIGVVQLDDSFATASESEQQAVIDKIKESVNTEKSSRVIDFAKDTGGSLIETAGDLVIDTVAAIPGVIGDLLEGRVDRVVFKLGGIILGNVGELVITVGANGLFKLTTATGEVIIDELSEVDVKALLTKLKNPTVQAALKGANFDNVKEKIKYATGIGKDITSLADQSLLDKGIETWKKIANSPGAAALGFVNELTLDLLVAGLDAAGYNASGFLEANPEAAQAGKNVGFVISLAGGPALAAKIVGNAAKNAVRKTFRGHAKRKNTSKILKSQGILKKKLEEIRGKPKYRSMATKIYQDIKSIDGMLRNLRSKRFEFKEDPAAIRNWWREEVNQLPSSSLLRQHPDIYDNVFDRLLATQGKASNRWFEDLVKNPLKDNFMLLARNWPSGIVEVLGLYAGDAAGNYALAYRNAIQQGLPSEEAADLAFAFMLEKTPLDVAIDIAGKVTEGSLFAFAPSFARLYIAASRTEDGKIINPEFGGKIGEAAGGGRDISPKGEGGAYGVPRTFSLGGFVKPKSLIARSNQRAKMSQDVKQLPIGTSPMNPLIGSPNNQQLTKSLIG